MASSTRKQNPRPSTTLGRVEPENQPPGFALQHMRHAGALLSSTDRLPTPPGSNRVTDNGGMLETSLGGQVDWLRRRTACRFVGSREDVCRRYVRCPSVLTELPPGAMDPALAQTKDRLLCSLSSLSLVTHRYSCNLQIIQFLLVPECGHQVSLHKTKNHISEKDCSTSNLGCRRCPGSARRVQAASDTVY
jgi:hypothetical protein